ncbi:MAG: DUF4381 domain-containing protein [Proteobacteria bacterium]|nr:DUF4381 domain-containing protein [Pseudomonadota bacterium]
MKSTNPASLQNLNDIVMPANIGWWPLATGWYFLLGLLLLVFAWSAYRLLQHWLKNRYRREALHKLQLLENSIQNSTQRDASLRQIPVLLKRTALSAYPREQVASLTGKDWISFLNSCIKNIAFPEPVASTLEQVAYSTGELGLVDSASSTALLSASRHWLKDHRTTEAIGGDK